MPRLGESVDEGEILNWIVAVGDRVAEFDPLVEVSTDKVDSEVPAPATGVLKQIIAEVGAVVPVGEPIGVIELETA
ncbi:biotin/lipoyl-containing protein [Mycobacterium sp. C31M]